MDPAEVTGDADVEAVQRAIAEVFEVASDLVVVFDAVGQVVWVNDWGLAHLGYSRADAIGTNVVDFVHPDEVGMALATLARSTDPARRGDIQPARYRIRCADGSHRQLWCNGNHVAGVGLNVLHGRRIAEVEVFEQVVDDLAAGAPIEASLRSVLRFGTARMPTALQGIGYRTDAGAPGVVADVDAAVLGSLDDPATPLGWLAAHADGSVRDVDELPDAVRGPLVDHGVRHLAGIRLVDPLHAGPCVAVSMSADADDPHVVAFVVAQMSSAIQVILRVRHQLVELRRLAGELTQFLADASHELRTPLTSIIGYAELHRAGALDDQEAVDEAFDRIRSESHRLLGLVEDLLVLTELGLRRPLDLSLVDLAPLVADVVADATAASPDRRIVAELVGGVHPEVRGDEHRLRQVLTNLVANAREHTPAGTPVEVVTRVEGEVAVIDVVDHGSGLTADEGEAAFRRFWRATSASSPPGGRGLGLPIARALAEAHGGSITARPTPGGGATFRVRIPVAG